MFVLPMTMIGLTVLSGIHEDDGDKNKGIWATGLRFNRIAICRKRRGYHSMNISPSAPATAAGKLRADPRPVAGANAGKAAEVMLGDT